MKTIVMGAAIALGATSASAATVNGFNDVTDNGGGSYTFVFDTVSSDIIGTGMGLKFSGGGVDIIATSGQGRVIQDEPAHGGLGVLGRTGSDNLEISLGEQLILSFSRSVEIIGFTFNGLSGQNGHQPEADGALVVGTVEDGESVGIGTSGFDGEGGDDVTTSVCRFAGLCDVDTLTFMNFSSPRDLTLFKGYLESVTIRVEPIPLPATLPLLFAGMAGMGFVARKRRS